MPPTLKKIAAEALVSVSTASRVLRYDSSFSISEETRNRIWQIANRLGYPSKKMAPNKRKNSGSHDRTMRLVYILPPFAKEKFRDPILSEIIGGIEDEIVNHGYYLGPCHNVTDYGQPEIYNRVARQQPDGAIFLGHVPQVLYHSICELIPHRVSIFSDQGDPSINSITVDFERHGYDVVKYLIERGHQRIAFIGGGDEVSPEDNRQGLFYAHDGRFKGYLQALLDHGIRVDNSLIRDGAWQVEQAHLKARELISVNRDVTAIFTATDRMAIGAMRAIHEAGLRIPEDMSIVGFDNIYTSGFFNPPITTVEYDEGYMGRLAVQYLIEVINGRNKLPVRTVLPCEMIERQSAGPARMPDPRAGSK